MSLASALRDQSGSDTATSASGPLPLVLDLDGTLLRADVSAEQLLAFLKRRARNVFVVAGWLLRGRAFLKRKLSENVKLDIEYLPVNVELIEYAKSEASKGRPVYIATASDEMVAHAVAMRFPFIAGVLGSNGKVNLKGSEKARALNARFPSGFDYAGNAAPDVDVWKAAAHGIIVDAPASVERRARKVTEVAEVFKRPSRLRALAKSMRVHQWSKNALIFVPAILSGRIGNLPAMTTVALAFAALCLIASATYIVNDVWDMADDRRHWSKRDRAIASGRLALPAAAAAAIFLLAGGLAIAFAAGFTIGVAACIYIAITLAYSMRLKQIPILDAFVLASLFTLRLGIGIAASGAPPSHWLLVFSMFFFGSLSFAKRHTEIARVIARGETEIKGRGYILADLPLVLATGVATGMAAVLIMVLYIINDAFMQSFYGNTSSLWGFPPLLFGFLSRIWLLCQRGQLNDDPVAFAIKDKPSLMMGAALSICFVLAWAGLK